MLRYIKKGYDDMLPSRRFDLFDDLFKDSFFHSENKIMKTDIKENENNYLIDIEMPGYDKEDIKIEVEEGYLNVSASRNVKNDEEESNYVRRERYYGECSRSFYVGESIEVEDVKASYKNGILKLEVPKKEEKKEIPEKKYVQIDD